MNEVMIERWNSVVGRNDIVYHLGDFCFGKSNIVIASRLNGKKRLIMGNHDSYPASEYLSHFEKLLGVKYWKMCVLTHIPVHPDNLGSRAFLNVHGHLHSHKVKMSWEGTWKNPQAADILGYDHNYFNVSVEQNNLYPFNAEQILMALRIITE